MRAISILFLLIYLVSCNVKSQSNNKHDKKYEVTKTEDEWKSELSKMSYYVLREAGTERAFTGILNYNKKKGTYVVQDARHHCMIQNTNMNQVRVGLLLIEELKKI